ncbi:MAG: sporulation protein [Deinococcus sp.]|uniref:sporulation protein n=1 Tax=Deinococcus sp. TaxID=47478 RepID=UPI0026DB34A9|nr:sporulation protein [Deinococcus sp.]MDO4246023.1 sporulation protein [Deinococcus sp.]
MGFFKKMMAAAGIGAARVDARLHHSAVRVGEELRGTVTVTGGKVEQHIERLNLGLTTRYRDGEEWATHTLFSLPVVGSFSIRPGEVREFPFSLPVPYGTPLTVRGTDVWLVTDADIAGGMDPGDTDPVQVLPDSRMATVIEAAQLLGFMLKGSEVEYHHGRLVQELSFTPPYGQYSISELEVLMLPAQGGLDVVLEVDRRAQGLASLFVEEFETKGRWFIPDAQLQQGPQLLAQDLAGRIRQLR